MSNDLTTNENNAAAPHETPIIAITDTMDKFLATADVKAVYGAPIKHGDTWVIPSAEIISVSGFGLGSGGDATEGGGGGGGGGKVFSRPVAVIISGPDGVRVEPVVDATKVALAFFTAIGFMAGMAMRMKRLKTK